MSNKPEKWAVVSASAMSIGYNSADPLGDVCVTIFEDEDEAEAHACHLQADSDIVATVVYCELGE